MRLLDLFRNAKRGNASHATDRLRIIVAQERAARNSPDYLPMLKRELLEVIHRYVHIEPDAVRVRVEADGDTGVLELSVALPNEP